MKKCKDYELKKKLGVTACIEALGWEFYNKYENSVYSCGQMPKGFYCYVGVNTHNCSAESLCLTNGETEKWEYFASCYVVENNENYDIVMDECKLP